MNTKVKKSIVKKQQDKYLKRPLIEGANLLIKEIKSPANLLAFLSDSIWWSDRLAEKKKEMADNFTTRLLIEHLVQPWFENGKNLEIQIADGLGEIEDWGGPDFYWEYIGNLLESFGSNMKDGAYVKTVMNKYLLSINTFINIGYCIDEYSAMMDKQTKTAA